MLEGRGPGGGDSRTAMSQDLTALQLRSGGRGWGLLQCHTELVWGNYVQTFSGLHTFCTLYLWHLVPLDVSDNVTDTVT